jgi:hypothetical protein
MVFCRVISLESWGSRGAVAAVERLSSLVGEICEWWLTGPVGPENDGFLRMPDDELVLESRLGSKLGKREAHNI